MVVGGELPGGDADGRYKPPKMTRMTCSTRSLYLLPRPFHPTIQRRTARSGRQCPSHAPSASTHHSHLHVQPISPSPASNPFVADQNTVRPPIYFGEQLHSMMPSSIWPQADGPDPSPPEPAARPFCTIDDHRPQPTDPAAWIRWQIQQPTVDPNSTWPPSSIFPKSQEKPIFVDRSSTDRRPPANHAPQQPSDAHEPANQIPHHAPGHFHATMGRVSVGIFTVAWAYMAGQAGAEHPTDHSVITVATHTHRTGQAAWAYMAAPKPASLTTGSPRLHLQTRIHRPSSSLQDPAARHL
ncbi:hypothetical protein ACLOJK_019542 [Asimina triloba]